MPAPSNTSPNVGNLQVGKGIVSFKAEGAEDFRDLGNVTDMTITPDVTTLDHFTSRAGIQQKDLTIVLQQASTVKLTMEEMTADNISLMFQGTVDEAAEGGPAVTIFGAAAISGWLKFVGTNDVGPKFTVDLYNVSFSNPSGDFSLISDEWNNMEATGDVLIAPDGDANAGLFGKIQITNVTPAS